MRFHIYITTWQASGDRLLSVATHRGPPIGVGHPLILANLAHAGTAGHANGEYPVILVSSSAAKKAMSLISRHPISRFGRSDFGCDFDGRDPLIEPTAASAAGERSRPA